MIDDLPAARPQSGLHLADVVWQAPAEGGIPRYMAIFQTHLPEAIGPVRSARSYYVAWASELKALYAHAGGSPQALAHAARQGPRPVRLQRRRVPLGGPLLPPHPHALGAAQRLHERQPLRKLAKRSGAKDKAFKSAWVVRAGRAARRARRTAGRSRSSTRRTRSSTATTASPTRTGARSAGEGKQIDASDGEAGRAEERGRDADVVRPRLGDKKHRLEADFVGSGQAWISTNGQHDQGHVAQERA